MPKFFLDLVLQLHDNFVWQYVLNYLLHMTKLFQLKLLSGTGLNLNYLLSIVSDERFDVLEAFSDSLLEDRILFRIVFVIRQQVYELVIRNAG